MSFNSSQQILQAIKNSQQSLVVFKREHTADSVAGSLALFLILKKMNKIADIVCDSFNLPQKLSFLPAVENINSKIFNLQKFIISVDIKESGLDELSYDIKNDKLSIYLNPKQGNINPKALKTSASKYRYDLIFVIDSPDLESLENVYHYNRDFFYNTTIINIDHGPENEHFGQINYHNPNAVSTSEILFNMIESFGGEYVDPEIANCLLTGLISKTNGFKTANVTPNSLNIASQLMTAKADRQMIIKNLFRSQDLPTLNLWGRALARLKSDLDDKLAWSIIAENDFLESRSQPEYLNGVVNELISSLPKAEVVVLFVQRGQNIEVSVTALKNKNALILSKRFSPDGSKSLARFYFENRDLIEVEKEVIDAIKVEINK